MKAVSLGMIQAGRVCGTGRASATRFFTAKRIEGLTRARYVAHAKTRTGCELGRIHPHSGARSTVGGECIECCTRRLGTRIVPSTPELNQRQHRPVGPSTRAHLRLQLTLMQLVGRDRRRRSLRGLRRSRWTALGGCRRIEKGRAKRDAREHKVSLRHGVSLPRETMQRMGARRVCQTCEMRRLRARSQSPT